MDANSSTLSRFPSSDSRMMRSKRRLARSCGVMDEISTAAAPRAPAIGAAPGAGIVGSCPARCAAKITTSVMNASPPRIHGRLLRRGGASTRLARAAAARVATWAPAGAPQSWQNFAPGVSDVPHTPHRASRTTAPHSVQYRPDAGAPQDGHGMELDGAGGEPLIRLDRGREDSIATIAERLSGNWLSGGRRGPMLPAHASATIAHQRGRVRSAPKQERDRCRLRHSRVFRARSSWRS